MLRHRASVAFAASSSAGSRRTFSAMSRCIARLRASISRCVRITRAPASAAPVAHAPAANLTSPAPPPPHEHSRSPPDPPVAPSVPSAFRAQRREVGGIGSWPPAPLRWCAHDLTSSRTARARRRSSRPPSGAGPARPLRLPRARRGAWRFGLGLRLPWSARSRRGPVARGPRHRYPFGSGRSRRSRPRRRSAAHARRAGRHRPLRAPSRGIRGLRLRSRLVLVRRRASAADGLRSAARGCCPMTAFDRALLAEKIAAVERHLVRVEAKLPEDPARFTPGSDSSDAVVLHLWQAVQIVIDLALASCIHFKLGTPASYAEAFRFLAGDGRLEKELAERLVGAPRVCH